MSQVFDNQIQEMILFFLNVYISADILISEFVLVPNIDIGISPINPVYFVF